MQNGGAVIELIDVKKSFGTQQVLRGIDLTVAEGTTTVIVGASGEGKSILLKHMLGLIRPDHGQVLVFGEDLARISSRRLKEIRAHYGVLFQNSALLDSLNVFDNVALPLRERTKFEKTKIRQMVEEKLAIMGLEGSEEKYPAQLSGGMQKRVGLARALIMDPRVLFCDEPTTGLDAQKSHEIYRLFYQTQERFHYTAVIVSHDVPKIFKLADHVAMLADGRIQGFMTPEEFQLSRRPLIRSFVMETMGQVYSSEEEEASEDETR